jgi:simple sugar transport system substrate-binding protein
MTLTAGFGSLQHRPPSSGDAHFVLISHAPDSDSWWNTIKNAIKQADEDFNVETDYRNPPNGDIADMSRLIEQAAARNYDGVIVTIADFDVLKSSIGKVTASRFRCHDQFRHRRTKRATRRDDARRPARICSGQAAGMEAKSAA